jgi:hypothetical protein
MKKIALFLIFLLFIVNQTFSLDLEIRSCHSGRETWKCEIGEECKCFIIGNCTDGNLIVFKENITNVLCTPKIENEIAIIDWSLCGNYTGKFDVIADCEEGQSIKKTVTVVTKLTTTTTTTILIPLTTTTFEIPCIQSGGYCGREGLRCCPGLECCEDKICRKICREETKLNIWLIAIGVISVLIVIGVLFLVGNVL